MALEKIDIDRLVAAGESPTLELKTSVPNPDVIASHLAAFANTKGGILLIGVKEPSTVVGVNSKRAEQAISAALEKLHPKISVQSGVVKHGNVDVTYVEVQKSPSLVTSSGGYYARYGTSIRPLSADEIRSSRVSNASIEKSLSELSANSARQAERIDEMRDELSKANSTPRKLGIAVAGAAAGALIKYLFEVFA